MASQQAPDAISKDEINMLKLTKMAHGISRSVLYKVFLWGTLKEPEESVEHYLRETKKYSNGFYRKCFDRYQIELVSKRTLESKFDVSTLFKVIKHTCDKVDTSLQIWPAENDTRLELLVTAVKDFRNDNSHNFFGMSTKELDIKSNCLMDLLERTLTVAGILYKKDVSKEIQKVKDDIECVRDQMLVTADICIFEAILFNEKLKAMLKSEGAKELRERYEHTSQLNPVSFLEGKGVLLDINMVFTQIEVENAGHKGKGLQVPCHEILTFCRDNTTVNRKTQTLSPEVYLIEGPAGVGKTTLMKYMKAVWLNKGESILGLEDFDLLLYMECRNPSLASLSQLLCHLLPKTNAAYFKEGELLKFTLDLKTLILVDGLDELNSSSEKLFLDIINQNNNNLVVLCTSRPEKARHFQMHVPSTYHTAHLKIIGIADNEKEEFIKKYHGELQKHGRSMQDTKSLIGYVKRSQSHLHNHFRLPLNLVLLTWLWADNPDSVTPLTTSSELYIQMHNLMKKKLVERLVHHEDTYGINLQDLEEKLKKVLCSVYKAALHSLSKDAIESLLPESVDQMEVTCVANNLPFRETISAFFVIKLVEGKETVSVPHKLLHDFYAAQCVVQNLFHENIESKNKALLQKLAVFLNQEDFDPLMKQTILSMSSAEMTQSTTAPKSGSLKALITDLCSEESKQMSKYQSMLLHVAGIIYSLHEPQVQNWIGVEIVELLKESELGIKDNNQWFDLFELTKNDSNVIRHAANYICKAIIINEERVEAAVHLLLTGRPKKISLHFTRETQSIPDLQSLMKRIANCESQLDLGFWHDFWNPGPSPSNDQDLRIISQRCRVGQVVCHVSGNILAEIRGAFVFLSLAVTSDLAAQEVMFNLTNLNPDLQLMGLCLHVTTDVSPSAVGKIEGINMLCLCMSEVQDCDLDRVCEMAKAILPRDIMLLDLRFPRSQLTSAGCIRLLKKMKEARIGAGHVSIPEEVVLQLDEQKWLKNFAHTNLCVRCAFRRLSKEQMWKSPFSAT